MLLSFDQALICLNNLILLADINLQNFPLLLKIFFASTKF